MKLRFLLILAFALGLSSCDKVKQLAQKASTAATKEMQSGAGATHAQVDNSLQALVDQTAEGVVFRKDLPFPENISIKTTLKRDISGRFFHSSELGKKVENIQGFEVTVAEFERSKGSVRYALKEATFTVPAAEKNKEGKMVDKKVANPLKPQAPSTQPLMFSRNGGVWKVDGQNDFRSVVLSRQLGPVFDELLIEQGLAPRPLWFSKKRLKVGDELTLADESVRMLIAGNAKGNLQLKLQAIEAVSGHPCGVFAVSGSYNRSGLPEFDGTVMDEEITIESGKLWLSLLYPVVLKEELSTIQTFKPGAETGLVGRGQGVIKHSRLREWKPVTPGGAPDQTDRSSVSLNLRVN